MSERGAADLLTHSLTHSLRTSLHHRLPPVQTLLLLSLFFFGRIIDYFSSGCSPPLCRRGEIERPPPPFHWDCVAESCGCDFLVWMRSAMRWSRGERQLNVNGWTWRCPEETEVCLCLKNASVCEYPEQKVVSEQTGCWCISFRQRCILEAVHWMTCFCHSAWKKWNTARFGNSIFWVFPLLFD